MASYQHVKGADEVIAELKAYPAKIQARVVRNALAAGARVVRDAARGEVPVKSGALARSIRVSSRTRKGVSTASVKVGNKAKGVFYGHMVIGGTQAHNILPRKGKGLKFGNTYRSSVLHPGARANPFMDRSRASVPRALDVIVERAKELTDKLNAEIQGT